MERSTEEITNKATRRITSVLGIILAIAGFHHGIFEVLQGNKPTNGLIIQSIGIEFQRWANGEEAFTIIPNFLATGFLAICVSSFIIIWAILFVQKKYGRIVFLLFFILLTLVGGGIAHIVFFLPTWAYATRMNKSLYWWKRILSQGIRKVLSKIWLASLIATVALFIIALEISVFGIPGTTNYDTILITCWSLLLASLVSLNLTFVSGFAYDVENRHSEAD